MKVCMLGISRRRRGTELKLKEGKVIQFIKVEDILKDILINSDKKMEIENLYQEKIS